MANLINAFQYNGKFFPVICISYNNFEDLGDGLNRDVDSLKYLIEKIGFSNTVIDLQNAISSKYIVPNTQITYEQILKLRSMEIPVSPHQSRSDVYFHLGKFTSKQTFAQKLLSPFLIKNSYNYADLILSFNMDDHTIRVYKAGPLPAWAGAETLLVQREIFSLILKVNLTNLEMHKNIYRKALESLQELLIEI